MSTAAFVPETLELSGDDARDTLRRVGARRLLHNAVVRLRAADGTSHARSLAFTIALVLVQGIIGLVGLASALGRGYVSDVVAGAVEDAVPGPAGETLTEAVRQAGQNASSGEYVALVLGLAGALVTATTAMGQLERGLNRLYGVERDRPSGRKYVVALGLALTSGLLAALAIVAVAFGRSLGDSVDAEGWATAWNVARWPLGLVLLLGALALLFRYAPRRRQPRWSWLAFGATVSVLGTFAVTALLALFFRFGTNFGDTYGPLAGIVALLLWSFLVALAVLFGGAVAAQLEAVRAGAPAPRDLGRVGATEPVQGGVLSGLARLR